MACSSSAAFKSVASLIQTRSVSPDSQKSTRDFLFASFMDAAPRRLALSDRDTEEHGYEQNSKV
jgi:hypothetical protein